MLELPEEIRILLAGIVQLLVAISVPPRVIRLASVWS